MDLDPVFLSRLQWGWVIAWHILLPAFTVGLASYIAVLEGLYFFTRRELANRLLASVSAAGLKLIYTVSETEFGSTGGGATP